MTTLTVTRERVGPILGRHPWVFAGALADIPEGLASGSAVRLVGPDGRFLAQGYFNSYSQIAVRLWSWDPEEQPDRGFFRRRIARALALRQRFVLSTETDSCRLIFSENDLLPGLVVDRYADCLCCQFHTRGIEAWRDEIVAALVDELQPRGIYERSDVKVRAIEGETDRVGLLHGEVPELVEIRENGLRFLVDLREGQKTGFFLDQRDKRQALRKYAAGKRVLNCFSYTGGFSIYAGAAGAERVVSVDTSAKALAVAEETVRLNGLDASRYEFVCGDAKRYLASLPPREAASPEAFEVIVLDPPAFIKDRRKIKEGLVGYRKINEAALRALSDDGVLVTASCSGHLNLHDFRFLLSETAGRSGRCVQILETHGHGIDHPELVAYTEGSYLKCFFCAVSR
jgi:23S rRNA (cytosine1962-C5)-methyltransferase